VCVKERERGRERERRSLSLSLSRNTELQRSLSLSLFLSLFLFLFHSLSLSLSHTHTHTQQERELRDIFSKYGTLTERPVIKKKMAFIAYADAKSATKAINCEQVYIFMCMYVIKKIYIYIYEQVYIFRCMYVLNVYIDIYIHAYMHTGNQLRAGIYIYVYVCNKYIYT